MMISIGIIIGILGTLFMISIGVIIEVFKAPKVGAIYRKKTNNPFEESREEVKVLDVRRNDYRETIVKFQIIKDINPKFLDVEMTYDIEEFRDRYTKK